MSREVLVVGAGMAGLTLAAARVAAGDRVTVIDKGHRHGGRMATRRVDDASYDTGVASFAAHGPRMREAVADWVAQGHAEQLVDGTGVTPRRFQGRPTMRSLPTALAEASGADVLLASTVVGLDVADGRWRVTIEEGRDGPVRTQRSADVLVLTCPAPQAAALLRTGEGLATTGTLAHLEAVTYDPCLAVLVRPSDPTRADARIVPHTLRADATFSATHLDGDRSAAAQELAARASEQHGLALEVVHVHGWRYAQVRQGIDAPALRDDAAGPPLVIAGDLCTSHDELAALADEGHAEGVEHAFLSGRAAATLLEDR